MPAIKLISSLPNFVSREEYDAVVASTPSSFSEIPPVVVHKEDNVSVQVFPPLEGFTDVAKGTVYVLTSVLIYMSSTGHGFQVEYPAITLHAISRSELGPSIYCQLDDSMGEEDVESAKEDDASEIRELSIIVPKPESLESIFEALSKCASLHPDKPASENDSDDAFVADNSTQEELSGAGRAALAYLESIIYNPNEAKSNGVDSDTDDSSGK